MTGTSRLGELTRDRVQLLAVCEQVSPSMNGASARRLAIALDDLSIAEDLLDEEDRRWLEAAVAAAEPRLAFWRDELARLESVGVGIITCVDPAYPTNLAMIHDRPPMLFVKGAFESGDVRSVAVVGSRQASAEGIQIATELSRALAATGVTIISGLARGIDAAAHAAAINAGGRTIAVFGTTIDKVYPAAHKQLASSISRAGACVSQFLPTTSTGPWCFPVRNITTSGLSLGTIVVEAGETSGAKLQAEAALAHGKRVFLVDQLVTRQQWAREMADQPGVMVASDVDAVLSAVDSELAPTADIRL